MTDSEGSPQAAHRPRPEDDNVPRQGAGRPRPEDDKTQLETPLLKVVDLRKSYDGEEVLKGLSFELYKGDILGFLGPNGAGKTTALRILATIVKASSGSAEIGGESISNIEYARLNLGYMPDFIGSYDDLSVDEYMEFFARAYLVSKDMRAFAKTEALSTTGMLELRERPVQGLSRGQSQRLALARLLMHDPPVLLLDEPAAGLDPRARVQLRDILRELQKKGKAIVVSSHVLEDLTDLSNKIAVIDRGELLAFGNTADLMQRLRGSRRLRIRPARTEDPEKLREFLSIQREVSEVTYQGDRLFATFIGGDDVTERLHASLFKEGFRILEFAEQDLGLEELYLQITSINQEDL